MLLKRFKLKIAVLKGPVKPAFFFSTSPYSCQEKLDAHLQVTRWCSPFAGNVLISTK
jgi:hypothetical protein